MSYFDEKQLQRSRWHCSLNLEKYFEDKLRGFYNKEHEYVATWYENRLSLKKSKTLVEVTFTNLTRPTYIDKTNGKTYQSFLTIALPINYLHKVPFGSIWKKGESEVKFKLEEYEITFSKKEQLSYQTLYQNKTTHPFEVDNYVHVSDIERFKSDRNHLLVIKQEDNRSYIIHPLHFFMAHYGYSSEIKRILITDNWRKVEEKLHLNEKFKEKGLFLPTNLSTKDAVFLYHLKYDKYTKTVVKSVTEKILQSKDKKYPSYRVPCWHDQPIILSFYGIILGNSVLCCQITGISQPEGEPITLYYHAATEARNGKAQESDEPLYRTRKQEREYQLEKLDITLNSVNNLVTADVIEYLQLLGEQRKIDRVQLTQGTGNNTYVNVVNYNEPTDFSVGEKQDKTANTGIANCFYDIPLNQDLEGNARLDTLWEHAKRLRSEKNCKVYWYTPQRGFNESDGFMLISLKDTCGGLSKVYPVGALIARVDHIQRTFFILSFPERKGIESSGFSSVVYEPQNIQQFLSTSVDLYSSQDTLYKLLIEIVSNNGVNSDYVDSKGGRMSIFRHVKAQEGKNNWVWNGIEKLL